jgi:hypothetical protein
MVLPVIGKLDDRIGIVIGDAVSFYNEPKTEEEKNEYSSSNIIDFNKANTMKDIIEKKEHVKSLENEIIVNSDNIFIPRIDDNDSNEMRALKEAVIAKQIDINAYAPRFGKNFANTKRLFNYNTISLGKLKSITDALDMKCTLTIEDKNQEVPNPINKVITADITGGDYDDEN